MKRREYLYLMGAATAGALARPMLRPSRAFAGTADANASPGFYLQIIPGGGMDAIYSVDAKRAKEVEPGVHVPYKPKDIIEVNGIKMAPNFKALKPWTSKLGVVNGFHQNSANHVSGLMHTTRLKSRGNLLTPTLLDILGSRRNGQALGSISIGDSQQQGYSSKYLGQPSTIYFGNQPGLFEHLDKAKAEDIAQAGAALLKRGETLGTDQLGGQNLAEAGAFMKKWSASPAFKVNPWTDSGDLESYYHARADIDRALWMFEHSMTRCAVVTVCKQDFDTHVKNADQGELCTYLAEMLADVFEDIEGRVVNGRKLSEQLVIFVGSEMGRFPKLNTAAGKDHYPQAPYLFYGKPVKGGSYAQTDRMMSTLPTSPKTGRPDKSGHHMQLDDIGTTLLNVDGANPALYGYHGKHLEFLFG